MLGFQYLKPETTKEAVMLLAHYGSKAKVYAGGSDLLLLMKDKELRPEYLIDISGLGALDYVLKDKEGVKIGSLTRLSTLERSECLTGPHAVLAEAISKLAYKGIREIATIGGNLCNASPAADSAPPLMALDSRVKAVGLDGERVIPIMDFFKWVNRTALTYDELLTEIELPNQPPQTGAAFFKFGRNSHDISLVNVAARLTFDNKTCRDVRIALGAVAPTPIRARKAEQVLKGNKLDDGMIEEASKVAADEVKPITDVRTTASHRKQLSKILVKRALNQAMHRATVD